MIFRGVGKDALRQDPEIIPCKILYNSIKLFYLPDKSADGKISVYFLEHSDEDCGRARRRTEGVSLLSPARAEGDYLR